MDKCKLLLLLLTTTLLSVSASAQYITVNDTYTPQQLVENILVNNQCVSISNVQVSGGNFSDGSQSYGYFNGAGTVFPLQNGIILSTGKATRAVGPNTSILNDGNNMNWGGDLDLQRALNINNSINATVLEFDFVPLANRISFTYLLSSEEYHDNAPCRYSDGFAFLIKVADNTSDPYTNLAIVPDTNIPVKVTSVHPQIGGGNGCPAQNEEYFDAFNGTNYPTNFNGQTKVMTATSEVSPGVRYHIKLVIADETNYQYDSAIFLGGGSFESSIDLGADRLFSTNNPLCFGESYVLNAAANTATAYQWYKDGRAIAGATSATYTAQSAGTYKVVVTFSPTCNSKGEIKLEYTNALNLGTYTLLQCDDNNDGRTVYNLDTAGILARNNDANLTVSDYFLTLNDAQANTNPIQNVTAFNNTVTPQPIFVRLKNQYGCSGIAQVNLDVSNTPLTLPTALAQCDTDGTLDGMSVFNLTAKDAEITQGLPTGLQLKYYTSQADAISMTNAIATPNTYSNTTPYNQTVYARLNQGSDCYGIVPLQLRVYDFGNGIRNEEVILCNNTPVMLDAGSGFTAYSWNTNPVQTTQQITVTAPGTYTVTLTNATLCTADKTFTVTASGRAVINSININDFNGGFNSVEVIASGTGIYEYSLNGTDWQTENTFYNVASGIYTVYVRDTNECGLVTKEIFVLDYPKFFTPNGDGANDVWHIPYLAKRPSVVVNIFDRYGKLIYSFKGNSSIGWDGTYKGRPLPATDYWFTITLESGTTVRGHFSLIR